MMTDPGAGGLLVVLLFFLHCVQEMERERMRNQELFFSNLIITEFDWSGAKIMPQSYQIC